ncbi:methylmalonyl-CoA mutase family protein [Streptomyces sp. S.PB5]|uniref:methylmalonyl-CoA mutase family protein n=1 Tax=Streptomyces sp. S.PB5 TaxID=3020844 RepID=UPI0025B0DFD5|nr:methylmalonyl-CoA mutase family protein [Streptomyces sp. S.PB5]MDN3025967.1 methylmalonyl-CoA mutase family protein [Streptomyces sp. S.PB5]
MDHILATAGAFNARYKQLLANGTTDLSVTFDRPTRRGLDSDAPGASGEVGRAGVAIDSLDDMRVLFAGIPLDKVSTALRIDAPAAVLLLLYQLVAEEQGVPADRLTGTIPDCVPGECVAPGPALFPPGPALRLTADLVTYGRTELPNWTTLALCGHPAAADGVEAAAGDCEPLRDPAVEARQAERLAKLRAWRCRERVTDTLLLVQKAAAGTDNVLYPMKDALAAGATVGEVCDALREVWGTYALTDAC